MTHYCHNSPDLSSCYHFIIGGSWLISPGPSLLSLYWVLWWLDRVMLHESLQVSLCHDSLQSDAADRGWRPLHDSGQRSASVSHFLYWRSAGTPNGFFRTKWVIKVVWKPLIIVPVIDLNYHFVTRHRWIITRHCQSPLRPRSWFTPEWLSLLDTDAASSDIRHNQEPCHQRNLNHHCSTFCRILN